MSRRETEIGSKKKDALIVWSEVNNIRKGKEQINHFMEDKNGKQVTDREEGRSILKGVPEFMGT